jgi:GH24 family phage-related lysozyme (muramidase)
MNVADYFPDLEAHESCVEWLYCDTRGLVTIGIGNLVENADACAALPLAHALMLPDGSPPPEVTDEDKRHAYCRVVNAFGPPYPSANAYRSVTDLRVSQNFVVGLVGQRLETEFYPGLLELCPGFDGFPLPARRALIDMAYNLGVHGLSKFPYLLVACNAGNWAEAARQCHRSSCRDSRNTWCAQCFVDASAGVSASNS